MNDSIKRLLLLTTSMAGLISMFVGQRPLKNPADSATAIAPVKWLQLIDMDTKLVQATDSIESFREANPPDVDEDEDPSLAVGPLDLPIKQLQKRLATLVTVTGGAEGVSCLREAVISFKSESGKMESLPVSRLLERYGMQAEMSLLPILTGEKQTCVFTTSKGDKLSATVKQSL